MSEHFKFNTNEKHLILSLTPHIPIWPHIPEHEQPREAELLRSLSDTLRHDSIFRTQTYPGDLEAGSRAHVCLLEPHKVLNQPITAVWFRLTLGGLHTHSRRFVPGTHHFPLWNGGGAIRGESKPVVERDPSTQSLCHCRCPLLSYFFMLGGSIWKQEKGHAVWPLPAFFPLMFCLSHLSVRLHIH